MRKPSPTKVHNPGARKNDEHSFGFARFLSLSSLVLILGSGVLLSIVIANSARETLLTKQKEFSLLLAENLNHQIYRRFILPTSLLFGRVELKQKAQYDRLEQVINSTIHGLHIMELRIYDLDKVVSFATNKDLVGQEGLADAGVEQCLNETRPFYEIKSEKNTSWLFLNPSIKPGGVILKTTFPLKVEKELRVEKGGEEKDQIVGVLEVYQDITGDYQTVIRFQWVIIYTTLITSGCLLLILLWIIRRTDRVNALRVSERNRLERELNQSEKLASIGRMVAGVAHEIRNPLGIIRSSAELLIKRAGKGDDVQTKILKAIYDEAKRLSQTVNDFLDYARPKQLNMKEMDLAQVLDQALVFLEGECAKQKVKVEKEYQPGLKMLGDKDLIYRAVYNVLTNSLQAMQGPGRIRIESNVRGKEISLSFRDSGPGFDDKDREKLLDPFFTTKDNGTGLGLTIMSNIVKSHQGDLELDNTPQGGAKVTMIFPAAKG